MSGDGPPLVLLHGFTGSTETWTSLRSVAEHTHKVIAVDLAGHGRSSAPHHPERYALTRFAHDLARVLDHLAIERAAIQGYSMGGRAAVRFAVAHKHRVAALVLESVSPGIAESTERADRITADNALADAIEHDGIESFIDKWEAHPLWISQRTLPGEVRAALRAQRLENRPTGLANSLRGSGVGLDEPILDRLGEIEAPTLFIAGALDSKYADLARSMATKLPHAQLEIIPDAGHAAHFEKPDAFARAVMTFLQR